MLYVIESPATITNRAWTGIVSNFSIDERNALVRQMMLGECADCGKAPDDFPRETGTVHEKINLNIKQLCADCEGEIVRPKRADVVAHFGLSSQRISQIVNGKKPAPKHKPKSTLAPAWFEVNLGGEGYDTLLAYDWDKEDYSTLGFDPDSFMGLVRRVEVVPRGQNRQADLRVSDEAEATNAFKAIDFVYYLVWGAEYGEGESPGVKALGRARAALDKKLRDVAKAKRKGKG